MKFIKKNINAVLLIAIIFVVNLLGGAYYSRLDLTQEKKYSLSPVTKTFLKNLDDIAYIQVFLTGKLPAGMEELEQSSKDMLNEFKAYAGSNLEYDFIDLTELDVKIQEERGKELVELGLQPTSLTVVENGEQTKKVIFPGAIVSYKGSSIPVTLLQNQVGLDQYQVLSNSITLLEYQFAEAIQKLQRKRAPTVAISQGHGEARVEQMGELIDVLQRENYAIAAIDLNESYRIEEIVDVLVLPKPTIPFSEKEKYKIDQFVMRGGRVFWMIDQMGIDMDSLQGGSYFFAEERDINLNDILFKYGVRVNADLVQDLQNTKLEVQTGSVNGAPQMSKFDWLYYPLFTPSGDHSVSKNLAPISGKFASTIDTIRNKDITKSVLLRTSNYSKSQLAPVRVHLGLLGEPIGPENFKQPGLITGVALEGSFTSIFKNRISSSFMEIQDSVTELKYRDKSETTKMIVISDGDIALNDLTNRNTKPLGFGYYGPNNSPLVFDNKPFLKNCFAYLIDDNNLIETRNKEFKLRQLDAIKVKDEKSKWQMINLLAPLLFLFLFGAIFMWVRKKRFAA